ncbi:DUF4350 domain-containing protein [soil metagenome]
MSVPAPSGRGPERGERLRTALPIVLLVAGIVVAALVAGPPGQSGPPLDPASTAADGTRALVDSLRGLGAEVELDSSLPGARADVALLLTDNLDDDRREELRAWVRDGGVLVTGDSFSPLTPEVAGPAVTGFVSTGLERGDCALAALDDVDEVEPGQSSVAYEAPTGSTGCFGVDGGTWLVAVEEGAGTIVALGGPEVLVNDRLAAADHPQLAAALLAPRAGTRVAFLRPPRPGEGEATLADLLPDRVRFALLQLAVAFVVLAWWRARRLGRVVAEPQPVELPGSELVTAVGNLLQHTGARGRAAGVLRDDVRRTLAERLGLPQTTPPEQVAAAVAARTGTDRDETLALLTSTEPVDDAALVRLAQAAERLRLTALRHTAEHAPQTDARGHP